MGGAIGGRSIELSQWNGFHMFIVFDTVPLLYIDSLATVIFHCLFTVVFISLLIYCSPNTHCWLGPVSKHFTVRSIPFVFGARDK